MQRGREEVREGLGDWSDRGGREGGEVEVRGEEVVGGVWGFGLWGGVGGGGVFGLGGVVGVGGGC